MGAGHPSQAECRRGVRAALAGLPAGSLALAAVSGGADSLALAAALAAEAPAHDVTAGAIIVDHQLQEESADVALLAAQHCADLGLGPVAVVPTLVTASGKGLEAAAREARYAALAETAAAMGEDHPAHLVLLGHTRDDQAEQVLLGLARGSGARSLAGMAVLVVREGTPFARPLLHLPRATTRQACQEWGLTPWEDPMNSDRAYARVRARQALADLEGDLGPGIAEALVRSADLLRDDADLLDDLAERATPDDDPAGVPVGELAELAPALRSRVWRRLLLRSGAPAGDLTAGHVAACDRLVTDWHGQGPLHLPGDQRVRRDRDRVHIARAPGGQ
ncbi:tRNA lysidine(34) synthetase TilS [Janibacter sp. YB324]|uniref:tRNA lysidine(34) synthetase TilS n=1 Tax=Janibacter sp. YB324 TaxID=2761047 RepID=UPI001626A1CA|nr:tRNA lysidine(34) synthetase TilS [Janibacter sp. YB324]QNF93702.1 tRNA lysidine(34) synthetase TilS [Janibacter sp. YB324]